MNNFGNVREKTTWKRSDEEENLWSRIKYRFDRLLIFNNEGKIYYEKFVKIKVTKKYIKPDKKFFENCVSPNEKIF